MGPAAGATLKEINIAFLLGKLIAEQGWVLLTGGRKAGVMDAASKGAKEAGGLTIGILPTAETDAISEAVDIPIITEMQNARNNINVLSSNIVIACGMGAGTASEVALAIKSQKKVILLCDDNVAKAFFKNLGGDNVIIADDPEEVLDISKRIISEQNKA